MTTWVIVSWVFVALITGINIFVFIKMKKASEQMMKMAFPGAKSMEEAVSQMQGMMTQANQMKRSGKRGQRAAMMRGNPYAGTGGAQVNDAQIQQAMQLLQKMQTPKK